MAWKRGDMRIRGFFLAAIALAPWGALASPALGQGLSFEVAPVCPDIPPGADVVCLVTLTNLGSRPVSVPSLSWFDARVEFRLEDPEGRRVSRLRVPSEDPEDPRRRIAAPQMIEVKPQASEEAYYRLRTPKGRARNPLLLIASYRLDDGTTLQGKALVHQHELSAGEFVQFIHWLRGVGGDRTATLRDLAIFSATSAARWLDRERAVRAILPITADHSSPANSAMALAILCDMCFPAHPDRGSLWLLGQSWKQLNEFNSSLGCECEQHARAGRSWPRVRSLTVLDELPIPPEGGKPAVAAAVGLGLSSLHSIVLVNLFLLAVVYAAWVARRNPRGRPPA